MASDPRFSADVACSEGTGFVKCHTIYSPLCDIFAIVKVNNARHHIPVAHGFQFSGTVFACAADAASAVRAISDLLSIFILLLSVTGHPNY